MRVTAFVTTIGAPTFAACIEHLHAQLVPCRIVVLDRVAPLAAALQRMADECATQLYVQVDEDMLLEPDAIARLLALFDAGRGEHAMSIAPLWDVDLEMAIYGVRICHRDRIRRVPFVDHPDGDIHDRARWEAAGLSWSKAPRDRVSCVGRHGTAYLPEQAFERWRRLLRAQRRTGRMGWVEAWPAKLRARYEASRSRVDLFAMLGAAIGATESLELRGGQDFRRPNPALEAMLRAFPG